MRPRGLIAISLLTAMSAGVAFSALGHVTSVPWALALTVLGVFWVLLPVVFLAVTAWDHLQSRSRASLQGHSDDQASGTGPPLAT